MGFRGILRIIEDFCVVIKRFRNCSFPVFAELANGRKLLVLQAYNSYASAIYADNLAAVIIENIQNSSYEKKCERETC